MREGIADLIYWLRYELRSMFGRRAPRNARAVLAVVQVTRQGIAIEPPPGRSKPEYQVVADATAAIEKLRKTFSKSRLSRHSVAVRVSPDRYLYRKISDLRLPRSKLRAMARLDVQASTPFVPEEVHIVCTDYNDISSESGYRIVKKSLIDPLTNALAAAGIPVSDIGFSDPREPGGVVLNSDMGGSSLSQIMKPSRWTRLWRGITTGLTIFLTAGFLFTAAHAHKRYSDANDIMDGQIADAQREARSVRQLIATRNDKIKQISQVRKQKQSAVPVAVILEEMARIIPDSAWVTNIGVQGKTVTFTGLAKSAASLIPILDGSPLFRGPTFKSPVVRANNGKGEQFTISMTIEAANG